jgi:DNA repair protein RadC
MFSQLVSQSTDRLRGIFYMQRIISRHGIESCKAISLQMAGQKPVLPDLVRSHSCLMNQLVPMKTAPLKNDGDGKNSRWPLEPEKLSDLQLLGQLFCRDKLHESTGDLVAKLLSDAGSLRALLSTAESGLASVGGRYSDVEHDWLLRLQLFGEVFNRALQEKINRGVALTSPADTLSFLQRSLRDRRREIFHCVFLDTRHRVLHKEDLFQGSIDGACVYPRVVAEHALRHNAAAVIVAHNHPSGVTEPSLADQAITRRLKEALSLLEIRLLDHFIIGDGTPVSMAARGML